MSTDEGCDANFNRRDNGGEDKAEEESDRKIEDLENDIYDDFEESQDIYADNCLVMFSKDW